MTSHFQRKDKVTVVVDIMEFVKTILPTISKVVDKSNLGFYSNIVPEDIVKWIIAKELWDAYNYTTIGLDIERNGFTMAAIYNDLCSNLEMNLTQLTLQSIPVLKVHDQFREIDLEIKGRDLFIYHYGEVINDFYNLSGWN